MKRLLLCLLLFSSPTFANELHLLQPRDVYIEEYNYQDMYDSYLMPRDQTIVRGGAFETDFDVMKYGDYTFYSKNNLHFDQDIFGHVRDGGWTYELGLGLLYDAKGNPKIEAFKQHNSFHIFEDTRPEHFPVYDRWGVRLRIWP